ncbi:MAG: hypothetical protein WC637_08885 [Victivallales bacterium]|jgi:hypothetical protein
MRSFYIFLNIFLLLLAVLLLAVNISLTPSPPDKILSMAPVLNESVQASQKTKGGKETPPDIASLWENNLFSPYRSGEGGSLLGPARPTGMELLGVCSFGEVSGAIIIDKQASAAAAPQLGRLRGRGTPSPGGPSATAPRFYKLGEQLENGFSLSEINSDSIVLSRGREQIVLKLEFEGESSISRNAAAAEAAAAAAATAAAAASAAIRIERNVPPETLETAEAAPVPGAPAVPGSAAAGVPAVPALPGVRTVPETPAISAGGLAVPGTAVAPGAKPRVQPLQSRRQSQPSDPANVR